MRKFLIVIYILQVASNEERQQKGLKKLGRGFFNAYRINPYNPLSYPIIILIMLIGFVLFGLIGFWRETDVRNPFKWN